MRFDYYYGNQADQFTFIRIPKLLMTDPAFSKLSLAAKLLYGLLLDRMGLSVRNGWFDEKNRAFIIYKVEEIQKELGVGKKTAIMYLNELEKIGLVEKKRRGCCLPNILYIKTFVPDSPEDKSTQPTPADSEPTGTECAGSDISAAEEPQITPAEDAACAGSVETELPALEESISDISGGVKMTAREVSKPTRPEVSKPTCPEVSKVHPPKNNTEKINTDLSNIQSNHIESAPGWDEDAMRKCAERISENIDLDWLKQNHPSDRQLVDGIYDLIMDVIFTRNRTIVIASNEYSADLVREKFLKLNTEHIEYVIECFNRNTTKVRNIKKYLLAALFNAPSTISGYYSAEVRHDMPQLAAI